MWTSNQFNRKHIQARVTTHTTVLLNIKKCTCNVCCIWMLVWLTERARLKCITLFASIATPFAHTNQGWFIDFSRTHTVYCSMCCVGTRISALSWLKRSFFVIRSFQYIIFHSIFIYFMHLDLFFYVIFFFHIY